MEHDQRVCLRCAEPAGDYRFCESCRSHIDSLTRVARAGTHAGDPIDPAAQVPREVQRFEQASAAASNGDSDGTTSEAPAAAVQIDPDPRPAENLTGDASAGVLQIAKLSTSVNEHVSDRAHAPREVARFEQVMTIKSTDGTDRVAAKAAAAAMPEVQGARTEADDTTAEVNAAPVREVELPTSDEAHASEPSYVAADALRDAFWFEQASAFKSNGDGEGATQQAPAVAMPEGDPDPYTADGTTSNVRPDPCEGDARQCAQPNGSRSVVPPWIGQASQRHSIAAICLLALIGLVAVLTGRELRRFIGGPPS